ncbi:MAG: radical SAM protein, partial [Candidatus Sumerlaeota bacterium]|nr:radical SAM protein [Candidatus Sumerlaeota bacterium]
MVRKSPETKRPPFRLILIKPSKYDNDGYVIRYWRGVLPSNTLAALAGLTRQAEERGDLGEGVKVELTLLDELAQRIDPVRLAKTHKRGGAKVAVGLVGVQTNQFPRAADLARQFTDLGVPAMIGGFHVSGALAMSETTPPELQELMDYGVTLVKGEVEDAWGGILRDVYEGRRRLLYDIQERPDITHAPIPIVAGDYIKKFAYPNLGTIDAGRGCPFSCSFCTI